MSVEEIFEKRKDNAVYNTSYPLRPSDWAPWKVETALPFDGESELSFYVHIPFCQNLCKFCEYVRYKKVDEETETAYLDIVDKDIANFRQQHGINKLLGFDIGGGTPTALSDNSFRKLLELAERHTQGIPLSKGFSGSIEGTFHSISSEKIAMMAEHPRLFNRLSFGLQNINKDFLHSNGRDNGSFRRMEAVFQECRKRGIPILNIDLMYGFPNQTPEDIQATMRAVQELMPEHVTVYELRTNMLHQYKTASAENRNQQYSSLYSLIRELGYNGMFGGNTFSRVGDTGLSSYLHNRMIENGSYKGFGIAAQSKSREGVSYNIGKNGETLEACLRRGHFEGGDTYVLPPSEMLGKYLAISGYHGRFDLGIMENITGTNPLENFAHVFDFLLKAKLVEISGQQVSFTPRGFKHYGAVLSLFYANN